MIVDCAVYEDGCRCAGELPLTEAGESAQRDNAFVWIDDYEPVVQAVEADIQQVEHDTFSPWSGHSAIRR